MDCRRRRRRRSFEWLVTAAQALYSVRCFLNRSFMSTTCYVLYVKNECKSGPFELEKKNLEHRHIVSSRREEDWFSSESQKKIKIPMYVWKAFFSYLLSISTAVLSVDKCRVPTFYCPFLYTWTVFRRPEFFWDWSRTTPKNMNVCTLYYISGVLLRVWPRW